MAFNKDSISGTLIVAIVVCLVCAVVVAGSAVSLKDLQDENKANDKRIAVLQAAGMYDANKTVNEQFENISTRIVNLEEGRFATESEIQQLKDAGYNTDNFDQYKAAKDSDISRKLNGKEDIASIKRLGKFASVYVVENNGEFSSIILPVHGYGLWSTLYGFIALQNDFNTVVGMGFYSHAETPGLGGEVDNPKWKALWAGKQVYKANGEVAIEVIKGNAAEDSLYDIDGLSGATLTSRGVNNLVHFWFGDKGFATFLTHLKEQGV